MNLFFRSIIVLCVLFVGVIVPPTDKLNALAIAQTTSIYQQRTVHSPDGIGKFYFGREIAQVMGHQGAGWLERSSREFEEKPSLAIQALNLKPTDVVADIGAGTGYFSFRIARQVPKSKVYAVDVQPEMIDIINYFKKATNLSNVEAILGSVTSPNLPAASVDIALMVDVYHELEYPYEMMQEVVKALKPGGRVVLIEYKGENPFIMIKPLHKMTVKQVRKEMSAVGLVWKETKEFLPQQHFIVFQKQ